MLPMLKRNRVKGIFVCECVYVGGLCTLIWKKKGRDNVFLMLLKGRKALKNLIVEH